MESVVGQGTEVEHSKTGTNLSQYREAVQKAIETEVRKLIDEEIRNATKEILDEQRKAIKQIVEEHRLVIREVVEEEKKAIWTRAEELRKSISKLGL